MLFYVYEQFLCMHINIYASYACMPSATDPLELELHTVVRCHVSTWYSIQVLYNIIEWLAISPANIISF